MTYNMIKTQVLKYQALHYNQIYNFILNHGCKFKIITMFKDIRKLKPKMLYVF
jgi:hypothetical protein